LLRLHHQTDELLRKSGVSFTILQPNSFHQNILSSANTIKEQGAFYWPLKNASQSTVDIRDVNAVATNVFTTSGHEAPNMGGTLVDHSDSGAKEPPLELPVS
jgi:uncharacterized protein YbjT (DUF2867 family)